ncbi:MAG: large repetitive protein, partial [Pseudonocardiales bacterium]|nr:large repetitive protein [Pseudonocardiales bacterium]
MTGARFTPEPAEAPPEVQVAGETRTGAGIPVELRITVTNRAPEPRVIAVTVLGMDAAWLPHPIRSRPVMSGESIVADLTLSPAHGTMPARYPFAIAVEALDPANGTATAPTAIADVALVVDEPSAISVELTPRTVTAVRQRKITLTVANTGPTPAEVSLEARSPSSTRVHLATEGLVVGAGQSVSVRGRIRVARPRLFGQRARHTYSVTARSAGAPKNVEGAVSVRAVLGPGGTKAVVLVAVVAVWVALAIVFIPKLSDRVKRDQNVAGPAATASGARGSSGSGQPGSKEPGGGQPGNPKTGSRTGAKAATVQLNGTVTGDSPDGVAVAISPTSLVNEDAQGASTVGFSTDASMFRPLGKVPQSALLLTAPRTISPNSETATGADGAWSIPSVKLPGYYLLTFSKPGYQTRRYIVDSSSAVATQPLKVQLAPGEGSLNGVVRGPGGPVGAAQITITDGTNTISASSNSTGEVGHWTVTGLSTPATYLVSISKDGLSTESSLVTLGAGDGASVPLTLKAGVASLVGTVQDAFKAGLGDVQVTATDGTVSRTASTVTTGPVGSYVLPDLTPGTYTVTFALDGYQTQTRKVVIERGASKRIVNASLTSASGSVSGTVSGVLFNDDGTPRTGADGHALIGGLNGAGLVLSSPANTYKTITTADGRFGFNGVAPGTYVLSAEYSGLTTGYVTVKAMAGKPTPPVDFNLALAPTVNTSTITGYVGSAVSSGGTLGCTSPLPTQPPPPSGTPADLNCAVTFTLTDSDGHSVATRLKDGDAFEVTSREAPAARGPTPYTLSAENGLAPGLYHLTIGADGYLPGALSVRVPANGIATAPQLSLYPANTIAGTLGALGELGKDGANVSYTNCVWAIPEGFSDPTGHITQPPTSCPTAADEVPDLTDCTTLGKPTPNLSIIARDNTYSIGGLCDGTYKVYVLVTNPTYVSSVPVATQAVSHGQTLDYSPHVPRKGRIILTFKRFDPSRGTVISDLATTKVSSMACTPASPASTSPDTTDASGRLIVSGVDASTSVTCAATIAAGDSPTGKPLQGAIGNLSVGDDNDTSATITLTQGLGAVIGRVVTTYGEGQHAVSGAQVNITGITGYSGTTPNLSAPTLVKTNENGCFGIVHDDGDSIAAPSWCGPLSAADGSLITLPLVGATATVDVQDTVGTVGRVTDVSLSTDITATAPANLFQVAPKPSSTAGLALVTEQTGEPAASLGRTTIRATGTMPAGAGTVTVTATGGGDLIWSDTHIGSGSQAWPGTYHLTATLGGYIAATATVSCPLPSASGSACTVVASNDPDPPADQPDGRFVLVALGSLTGAVAGVDPETSATQALAGATVIATCTAGQEKYGQLKACPTSSLRTQTDASGRYIFQDSIDTFLMTPGKWQVTVSAAGYTEQTVGAVSVDPGANAQATIQLDALGLLNGTVTGVDTNGANLGPIADATVNAHCEARPSTAPQCPASDPPNLKTDPSGRFSFTDPLTRYFMLPGSWTITITAAGYSPTPLAVTIASGTNTLGFPVSALGSLSGKVTGLGSLPLATATITYLYCGPHGTGCPTSGAATTSTDPSGQYSLTGSPTTYSLTLGDWQVSASALGYITETKIVNVTSGANPTNFALTARGTLTGTITGLADAPLVGATVSLACLTGTPAAACPVTDPATQHTDASGRYAFVGSDTLYVLTPGTWRITVSTPGYTASVKEDLAVSPGTNSYSTALVALGTLTGHLTGYLGTDTTYPSQPLMGAIVSAVECTVDGATTTCPDDNTGARTATSNSNGDFQFAGANSPYVLAVGSWKVTISRSGYTSFSQEVAIASGANTLPRNHLFVTPVTAAVGIEIAPTVLFTCAAASPACAKVVLTRTDTREQFTATT